MVLNTPNSLIPCSLVSFRLDRGSAQHSQQGLANIGGHIWLIPTLLSRAIHFRQDRASLRARLAKMGPFRCVTVSAVKMPFSVLKRKEEDHLYGGTERNRCI